MDITRLIFFSFVICNFTFAQGSGGFQIARLKYGGGGDWYNDPSAEVNLLTFIGNNTNIEVIPEYKFVDIEADDLFAFPFLFITGHGNIVLSETESKKLRTYLEKGGFLYIDDDYGIDKAVRRELKKIFPDQDLTELPFSHELYHSLYDFNLGPPKTHEHDNLPPKGYGLFIDNRLAVYYTFESNPSDGWTNQDVHHDPEEKRIEALKFGANLVTYVLTN